MIDKKSDLHSLTQKKHLRKPLEVIKAESSTSQPSGAKAEVPEKAQKAHSFKEVTRLLGNLPYLFIMLSISVLFFVISGIQYWCNDFLQEIHGLT